MTQTFHQTGHLLKHFLKRDRLKIILWIVCLAGFSAMFLPYFNTVAEDSGLEAMYETMQNPAIIAIAGKTLVTDDADYTVGVFFTQEMLLFCSLGALIISLLHIVSHTRKEENLGLTEIIQSLPVGRHAASAALIIENVLIHLVLVTTIIGMLLFLRDSDDVTTTGIILYASSIGAMGLFGGALGFLFAQLMPTSSGASGGGLLVTGLLFGARAYTDVSALNWSYFNPLSWSYLSAPFDKNRFDLLGYSLLLSVIIVALATFLEHQRDIDASYIPEPKGRAHAKKSSLSVPGWIFGLNRGVIITWLITFVLFGALYGSIYGDMQSFLEGNEFIQQFLAAGGSNLSMEVSFTSTIMVVLIGMIPILPIIVINRLYTEEREHRLELISALPVSRHKLYLTTMILAIVLSVIATVITTYALGVTALGTMTDTSMLNMNDFFKGSLNLFPTIVFFIGLAGLCLGFLPQLGRLSYLYLVYSFLLEYMGGMLDFPDWLQKTSLHSWFPLVPTNAIDWPTFTTVSLIGVALIVIGFLGYIRRDLKTS